MHHYIHLLELLTAYFAGGLTICLFCAIFIAVETYPQPHPKKGTQCPSDPK